MLPPQIIFGYHGCDVSIARMILNGGVLRSSTNPWDWLGHGIYFWERSFTRAMQWAHEISRLPHSPIKRPAVIGAIINLGHCLDLADPDSAELVATAYKNFMAECRTTGVEPARNKGPESKARFLDCAVVNHLHHLTHQAARPAFDTVRGFFNEGQPVYPTAGLRSLDHVQVCVRNPKCILGYFSPPQLHA
ncbi:MAG: hypothetical protein ACKVY0_07360 [Prosthecobacter sp.]|uniref:hypothetical protein n=1 Tax=Prosthecobacter sp. TaxID=1965333 RepID=UPI003902C7B2